MARIINTKGEIKEVVPKNGKTFDLDELQKAVGGYIEIVNISDDQYMVVNEDGSNLPVNSTATKEALENNVLKMFPGVVRGNVLICANNQIE